MTSKTLPSISFNRSLFVVKPKLLGKPAGKAVLKKQLELLKPKSGKVLGVGVYGKVVYERGGVHKHFKKPQWFWHKSMEGEHQWVQALQRQKYKPKHALPMQVSTGGVGIRMPFFRGLTLYNMVRLGLLKNELLKVMLTDLRHQVEEISRLHFLMADVHLNNIMVDPGTGHAKFIDYGQYKYQPDTPVLKLYVENLLRAFKNVDAVVKSRKANRVIKVNKK